MRSARLFLLPGLQGTVAILVTLLAVAAEAEVGQARRAELVHMLRQDCGSCHGITLKGGLGPALTAGALRDKPRGYLETVILNGKPGTPMAPWQRFMTREEVRWLVGELKSGDIDHDKD